VIPTFNEQENIDPVYRAVERVLDGIDWEIIFVDDSSADATVDNVLRLSEGDPRVRLIRRIGRRGLASACIEGMLASTADYVAVMDADLQHDESLLPRMLERLEADPGLDLVVGSRYCRGASTGSLARERVRISVWATRFSQFFARTDISDPMSGFFMLRLATLVDVAPELSGRGYKVLLDILMTSKKTWTVAELPYDMRARRQGDSKLDTRVAYDFFLLLADKTVGRYFPIRLLMFLMVGATGVVVQLLFVGLLHALLGLEFVLATVIATGIAMSSNFLLNNWFTYNDLRL
ncbi:MAG: glycosyltransferase, partial [Acidobacteria bacterium]|nr:glycosyltransferase [Acidobacteriota bacterium]